MDFHVLIFPGICFCLCCPNSIFLDAFWANWLKVFFVVDAFSKLSSFQEMECLLVPLDGVHGCIHDLEKKGG